MACNYTQQTLKSKLTFSLFQPQVRSGVGAAGASPQPGPWGCSRELAGQVLEDKGGAPSVTLQDKFVSPHAKGWG